ncbi:MAG: hypothetical protein ACLRWH_02315 [Emergencia sp.]|nr:hypothetical protein [Emergencia sp.]
MKHLITITACMMLLMALIMQMVQSQMIYLQVEEVAKAMDAFAPEIQKEGCVSESIQIKISEAAAEILGCSEEEIIIETDRTVVSAGEEIVYMVQIPIKDILAAPDFWKVDTQTNRLDYQIRRKLISCRGEKT